MKNIIQRGFKILVQDGVNQFLLGVTWTVWRMSVRKIMRPLSDKNTFEIDGVIFNRNPGNEFRQGDLFFGHGYGQEGEIYAHQIFTQYGDEVVIIGGGFGITTVHAARQVGGGGLVTVFEGGQIACHVSRVAQLNGVDNVVTVEELVIGDPTTLYRGMADDVEVIDPADLPACDVLEMDCEGSELGILEGMQIRPRVLIVELHPTMYDAPNAAPVELIEEMGYEMTYWSTQRGERMSEQEFRDRLADGCGDVLAAVRE